MCKGFYIINLKEYLFFSAGLIFETVLLGERNQNEKMFWMSCM
jgi:hypothetical protein